jgi:hypothetical protein
MECATMRSNQQGKEQSRRERTLGLDRRAAAHVGQQAKTNERGEPVFG